MTTELQEQSRGESSYITDLRATFRALWLSLWSIDEFANAMVRVIRRGFEQAWKEGAKECSIEFDELTLDERLKLELGVVDQFEYIRGVGEFIVSNSKANGGAWGNVTARVPLWANRYREAKAKAASYACANKKKQFVLGATKEHCRSCLGLNGRVYRYETWRANNAIPPSHSFECGGFQ